MFTSSTKSTETKKWVNTTESVDEKGEENYLQKNVDFN